MAVSRQYPYNQFNFQVKFGSTEAAFQEVSGLSMEVHVAEYRAGSASTNAPIKVTGLSKFGDVTFKRGVVGDISSSTKGSTTSAGAAATAQPVERRSSSI